MKFFLILIGFVMGFLSATYWEGGRSLVKDNAPAVQKNLETGLDKGVDAIKDGASLAKDKIKDNL